MAEKLISPLQTKGRTGLTKKKAVAIKVRASKSDRTRLKQYQVVTEVGVADVVSLSEFVDRCLENIKLARRRMRNDQIEIDRLREETRSLISDLMIA